MNFFKKLFKTKIATILFVSCLTIGLASSFSPVANALDASSAGNTDLISSGESFSCAVQSNKLFCWGNNSKGQLGNGNNTNSNKPVQVVGLPSGTVTDFALGYDHVCAVVDYNQLYCWGDNSHGQLGLGNGTAASFNIPQKVPFFNSSSIIKLSLGNDYTLALGVGGNTLWSWGNNASGQLAVGNTVDSYIPQVVSSLKNKNLSLISAGYDSAYAFSKTDNALYSWGANDYGQLGLNNSNSSLIPTVVSALAGKTLNVLSAGNKYVCASTVEPNTYCWGFNDKGQLGTGDSDNRGIPTKVDSIDNEEVTSLNTGFDNTCVTLASNNQMKCWGNNSEGQTVPGICTNGDTQNGDTCVNTYPADFAAGAYYCANGGTMDGTTCTLVYSASYSSAYYYCPSPYNGTGWSQSGSSCNYSDNAYIVISGEPYCSPGWYVDGGLCRTSYSATSTTYCSSGTLSGGNCWFYASKTNGKCPSGYRDLGSNCGTANSAYLRTSYSCPQGTDSPVGPTCYMHTSVNYGPDIYSCSTSGTTYSSGACRKSVSASYSSGYYYCSQSGSLSGTTCTWTQTRSQYPGTYSCPTVGDQLSSTNCKHNYALTVEKTNYSSPESVDLPSITGAGEITSVSVGNGFTCVSRQQISTSSKSSLYCWGENSSGESGVNNTVDHLNPQAVTLSNIDKVVSASTPTAPSDLSVEPSNGSALVRWTVPENDRGEEITSYTITSEPGAFSKTVPADENNLVVDGLTNGTLYSFKVVATNSVGDSVPASLNGEPSAVSPSPPTNINAIRMDTDVLIVWSPPVDNGGGAITGYTVFTNPESDECSVSPEVNTCTIHETDPETPYTITVVAYNSAGSSFATFFLDKDSTEPSNVSGESAQADVTVDSSINLILDDTDDSVLLKDIPGVENATTTDNQITYIVKTNNLDGYSVTIRADQEKLLPSDTNTNLDSIPVDLLTVEQSDTDTNGTSAGIQALSHTEDKLLYSQNERSVESGDSFTSLFALTEVPFVNADDYSGTITYTATAN